MLRRITTKDTEDTKAEACMHPSLTDLTLVSVVFFVVRRVSFQ
jgi:hypothetical protein